MYNQDIKEEFMKWDKGIYAAGFSERIFGNLAPYEKELQKDASNFTKYEIAEYYRAWINTPSYSRIANIHALLKKYANWCMTHNLIADGINHYGELDITDFYHLINHVANSSRFYTRENILNVCAHLQNPRDAFVVLAAFEYGAGKSENISDIGQVRVEWVDHNVIHLPTRDVKISDELYRYAQESIETKIYITSDEKEKSLVDIGCVFKPFKYRGKECNYVEGAGRTIRRVFRIIREDFGLGEYFTLTTLADCGIIHMARQKAAELGISMDDCLLHHADEIIDQYGVTVKTIDRIRVQYKDFF